MSASISPGQAVEPLRNFNFKIEIGPDILGYFQSCEGVGVQIESIEYHTEPGGRVHKFAGPVRYPPLRLRSGVIQGQFDPVWKWLMSAVNGAPTKRSVSLVMLGLGDGAPKMRWDMNGCWPTSWQLDRLDAAGRGVSLFELVLEYEDLKRPDIPG
jgi:phage tail-like protein